MHWKDKEEPFMDSFFFFFIQQTPGVSQHHQLNYNPITIIVIAFSFMQYCLFHMQIKVILIGNDYQCSNYMCKQLMFTAVQSRKWFYKYLFNKIQIWLTIKPTNNKHNQFNSNNFHFKQQPNQTNPNHKQCPPDHPRKEHNQQDQAV
jgi:hypothetical protein